MNILVADDLEETRFVVAGILKQMGHQVIQAADGEEALKILQNTDISFVLSDWMMPKMSGPELCKAIRSGMFSRYIYIILLTARSGKEELIEGMEAGADDFVVKPFHPHELKARVNAGVRILHLEKTLEEKNRNLTEINTKLQDAYSVIKKNLEAAAQLQLELLPAGPMEIEGYRFDWFFHPCDETAGDIFNVYKLNNEYICFYQLDVAGHGFPSALLAFTLSKFLTSSETRRSIFHSPENGNTELLHPAALIQKLNEHFHKEHDAMQYFTIIYGLIEIASGKVTYARAGHPKPILVNQNGELMTPEVRGFPVGMFKESEFEETTLSLKKGDRLFINSDGVTEAVNTSDEIYGTERLYQFLNQSKDVPLSEVITGLNNELRKWRGSSPFRDDISFMGIERVL